MDATELTDRLVDKSFEAFILGLEIYNKPTLKYRIEGFAFFVCNAWELMLKAKLITDTGMASIYYKDSPSRTLSLNDVDILKQVDLCLAHDFRNNGQSGYLLGGPEHFQSFLFLSLERIGGRPRFEGAAA